MPGIFGIVSPHPRPKEEMERDLEAMRRSMAHLPTYKSCTYFGDRVALGRIGPSFLNPERQPVFSEDGRRMIVFEGELFEPSPPRRRLTRRGRESHDGCDAEIVLQTFEEFGAKGIADLAGAYVGCIYDATAHSCHLLTDRLGVRVCFYFIKEDGTFLFASEVKAICSVSSFSGHVDIQATAEFLNTGYPFFERTLFKEVKIMPYGSVVSFESGRASVEPYWDVSRSRAPVSWGFEDAVAEGADLLVQAVHRQFRQAGPVGSFLSGGLDSRAIVAASVKTGHRVPTFTFGAGDELEARLAARVCRRLNLENERCAVAPDYLVNCAEAGAWYTDGMLSCTHFLWLAHLGAIQMKCRALLSGHLGNVLLGGVFLRSLPTETVDINQQRQVVARRFVPALSPYLKIALTRNFYRALEMAYSESGREVASWVGDNGLGNEIERASLALTERRAINTANGGLVGVFADVKYPFVDYDLLDYYTKLPVDWRRGGRLYKAIICKAFPELVDVPCISDNTMFVPCRLDTEPGWLQLKRRNFGRAFRFYAGRLTGGLLSLKDHRTYLHYDHWYRTNGTLRGWIQSLLGDKRTLDRGYFDPEGIRLLFQLEFTRGYLFSTLAVLASFEYWNRFFVDRQQLSSQALTQDATDIKVVR